MCHKMSGQNVDVKLIRLHVRIKLRNRCEAFIPKRHGINDAIRLGCRCDMFFTHASQLESISNDAVNSTLSENDLLNCHVELSIAVHSSTNLGVFAFAVFTHDHEVDVASLA